MKKQLLLIIVLFSTLNILKAQNFSGGAKLGVNFSTITEQADASSRVGLQAGVFAVYSIISNFGVSGELLYSGEGSKYNYTESGANVNGLVKLNYLRIPLLANVFFGDQGNNIRPKIFLGPNFGFLLASKTELDVNGNETSTDSKDNFNGFDLSALVGAGVNIKIADRRWLNVDARYNIGASDIRKDNPLNTDAVKNQGFSLSLGLAFGFGE